MRFKAYLFLLVSFVANVAYADHYQSNLISVKTEGKGPDVVLVHGFASSPKVWDNVLPALQGHTVHTVTIHGLAGAPAVKTMPQTFIPAIRDEVLNYVRSSDLKQPALIGHSMGGLISLLAASKDSSAFSQLIIVDALPFYSELIDPNATRESMAPMAFMTQMGLLNMNNQMFAQQAKSTIALLTDKPEYRTTLLNWSQTSNRQVYAKLISELMQLDIRPQLASIKVPTQVIYSHRNTMPWTLDQLSSIYKRQYAGLSGVKLTPVEDSLHFIMWDQPTKLNALIKAALQALFQNVIKKPGKGRANSSKTVF